MPVEQHLDHELGKNAEATWEGEGDAVGSEGQENTRAIFQRLNPGGLFTDTLSSMEGDEVAGEPVRERDDVHPPPEEGEGTGQEGDNVDMMQSKGKRKEGLPGTSTEGGGVYGLFLMADTCKAEEEEDEVTVDPLPEYIIGKSITKT